MVIKVDNTESEDMQHQEVRVFPPHIGDNRPTSGFTKLAQYSYRSIKMLHFNVVPIKIPKLNQSA